MHLLGCRSPFNERSLSVLLWLWQRGAQQPSAGVRSLTSARNSEPAPSASLLRDCGSLDGLISRRDGGSPLAPGGETTVTV